MKKLWYVLWMFLISIRLSAQIASFDTAAVPDSIRKHAAIIKRFEEITLEVPDIDHASIHYHQVLTVLNEEGSSALHFSEFTNKSHILADAEIRVYDAYGKQMSRYKKKDMATRAFGNELMEDHYFTSLNISASSYPVTVEYIYDKKIKGTLFMPAYNISDLRESVESSVFTAKISKKLGLRYKNRNTTLLPQISGDDAYTIYQWSVKNLPAVDYEEGASKELDLPVIELAPTKFSYYGFEGDLSTWKSYGEWTGDLFRGQDELPDDRKEFFRQLVKDAGNDRQKIKIIYEYLQNNFRYVSIQLGIGGFKPFSATATDQKKYGDCKALSNFMKSALNAVGIKSYVALVNAEVNGGSVDALFPIQAFNHVILCIPQEKEPIWLECTSPTSDFGVLGSSTENRKALLITENGGVLISTPTSKSSDNLIKAVTTILLNEDGSAKTSSNLQVKGFYKEAFNYIIKETEDDKKQLLVNYLKFKQPDAFSLQKKEEDERYSILLDMDFEKIPTIMAGSKMFLAPHVYKLWDGKLPDAANRRKDYYFTYPFEKTDTTIFKLPADYTVDVLPGAKELSCPYGKYTTKYWFNEAKHAVYSATQFQLTQYRIPATGYATVKKFFEDVMLNEAQRIVIKKG